MFNTIRARLTLWYASVLSGVLVAFSLGIYVLLSRALDLRVDANLQSIIDIARTSLTHDAQEGQTREDAARTTVDELSGPVQGLAIFDEDGLLLAAGGWDDFKPRLPAPASDRFQVYTVPEDNDDDEHLRIVTQRVLIPSSRNGYVILAGQSLEPIEDELESLRHPLVRRSDYGRGGRSWRLGDCTTELGAGCGDVRPGTVDYGFSPRCAASGGESNRRARKTCADLQRSSAAARRIVCDPKTVHGRRVPRIAYADCDVANRGRCDLEAPASRRSRIP